MLRVMIRQGLVEQLQRFVVFPLPDVEPSQFPQRPYLIKSVALRQCERFVVVLECLVFVPGPCVSTGNHREHAYL